MILLLVVLMIRLFRCLTGMMKCHNTTYLSNCIPFFSDSDEDLAVPPNYMYLDAAPKENRFVKIIVENLSTLTQERITRRSVQLSIVHECHQSIIKFTAVIGRRPLSLDVSN